MKQSNVLEVLSVEQLAQLRAAALHGAVVVLGHGRLDEAEDCASSVLAKAVELAPRWAATPGAKPERLLGWAMTSGRNLALRLRSKDLLSVSLDLTLPDHPGTPLLDLPGDEGGDVALEHKELCEALPRLADLIHTQLATKLDTSTRKLLESYYLDRLTFEQIGLLHNAKPATVRRRFYRALHDLQELVLDSLENWPAGLELFGSALTEPVDLSGLFALLRIRQQEGPEALQSAAALYLAKARLPQGRPARPARGQAVELQLQRELERLVGETVTFLKDIDTAHAECLGKLGGQHLNTFHTMLQLRVLELIAPRHVANGERERLERLRLLSIDQQHELGD